MESTDEGMLTNQFYGMKLVSVGGALHNTKAPSADVHAWANFMFNHEWDLKKMQSIIMPVEWNLLCVF